MTATNVHQKFLEYQFCGVLEMDCRKLVNFISLQYFDFAYNSHIKRLNQLSRA